MKLYRPRLPALLIALVALVGGSLLPLATVLGQGDQPPVVASGTSAVSSEATSPDATTPNTATAALGTSFTYQGNLQKNGQPINATCSFQFSLWDALTGGAQHGSTQNVNSVQVQDGSFTVQLDFGNEFTGDARWLKTAVQCPGDAGSTGLSPRQPLNAVPYALSLRPGAAIGDVRINGNLDVQLPNNSTQNLLVSRAGRVQSPILRLVEGSPIIQMDDSSNGAYIRANLPNNAASLQLGRASNVQAANPTYTPYMQIQGDGKVGIGTTSPQALLHIDGVPNDQWGMIVTSLGGSAYGLKIATGWPGGNSPIFQASAGNLIDEHPRFVVQANGKVGVGTTTPQALLHIDGVPNDQWGMLVTSLGGSAYGLKIATGWPGGNSPIFQASAGNLIDEVPRFVVQANGNVGVGTTTPQATLDVSGTIRTNILQIDGGADLAEPFAIVGQPEPGLVVAIDSNHIGQLRIADKAYDRTVAGVISGAGGLQPGLTMQQPEIVRDETHPVALTGRVYVWADASFGAIQPGDLLTTSATPGHAMKVGDYALAQGAILGKAMSRLEQGKGLVLVLVSLL